jgi:hypothetical protein
MYNFIFWFFYKFFEWRKGFKSAFIAGAMVGFALVIHLFLLYGIVRYATGFTLPYFSDSYGQRKLMLLPLAIVFFLIIYFGYYRKQAQKILSRYAGNKFSRPINILLIVLLLIVPLMIAIQLVSMTVLKN